MYTAIDLRDEEIPTLAAACHRIQYYRAHYPTITQVIISRSQRTKIVESDATMYAQSLVLAEQFGKAPSDLDFKMVLEHCEVIVE